MDAEQDKAEAVLHGLGGVTIGGRYWYCGVGRVPVFESGWVRVESAAYISHGDDLWFCERCDNKNPVIALTTELSLEPPTER